MAAGVRADALLPYFLTTTFIAHLQSIDIVAAWLRMPHRTATNQIAPRTSAPSRLPCLT